MTQITLNVNGRQVTDTVEPRTHLADFLREQLDLTGTHLRCEQGACGACTLLIDGQPARSCITYAAMCDGGSVRTIEGLENDAVMTALRTAFSQEHALQCGFCTPGMMMTSVALLEKTLAPTDDEIRRAISGNLCRCTGYVNIVKSVQYAAKKLRGDSAEPTAGEDLEKPEDKAATTQGGAA